MKKDAAVVAAVILAAGRGTRMKSSKAKVLHRVGGKTMLARAIDTALAANIYNVIVVCGHQKEAVEEEAVRTYAAVRCCEQTETLGTGHAVAQAEAELRALDADIVVVMCGDTPLIDSKDLRALVQRLQSSPDSAACVLTATVADPSGLGRIVRDSHSGRLHRIVEEKDCTSDGQRSITEVNSGTYAFRRKALESALRRIDCRNAQGEYYLTDTMRLLVDDGEMVHALCLDERSAHRIVGVNTIQQLEQIESVLAARCSFDVALKAE